MFQMGNSVFCCSNAGGSGSGDPVRNYGTLSSFYQMIVITSIHFTILPLALYLD